MACSRLHRKHRHVSAHLSAFSFAAVSLVSFHYHIDASLFWGVMSSLSTSFPSQSSNIRLTAKLLSLVKPNTIYRNEKLSVENEGNTEL